MKRPLQPLLNWSCWAALRGFVGTAGDEHAVRNVNKEPEEPAQVADQEESPVAEAWQGFVEAKVGPVAFGADKSAIFISSHSRSWKLFTAGAFPSI